MTKHVHAELMRQYAEDAMDTDRPWERWEVKKYKVIGGGGPAWHTCCQDDMRFYGRNEYRRKPKTSRERFEEWVIDHFQGSVSLDRDPHSGPQQYMSLTANDMWRAWQEAERQARESSDG